MQGIIYMSRGSILLKVRARGIIVGGFEFHNLLTFCFQFVAGPDRRIFLPEGLLDRSEIPEYLTGEVPGEYGVFISLVSFSFMLQLSLTCELLKT